MEKVSIIIPVYNRAELVKNAIKSALNQSYPNIEIVVVNDGSTDNTLNVLEEFASVYSNIKVITQQNRGVTVARQTGLYNATGDFVVFLDSDDLINNVYVEELMKVQRNSDASVLLARRFQKLNNYITLRYHKYPESFKISKNPNYLPTIWVGVTSKMFKKDEIYVPDFGLIANEDLAYIYQYLAEKNKIACSNKSIYTLGLAPNSLARDYIYGNLDHIDNTIKPLEIEYGLFQKNNLLEKYYLELEAVFIKNIMERIVNIKMSNESKDVKNKLIGILINYLETRFPNWRVNKYLKQRFVGFPLDSFFYLNLALPTAMKTEKVPNEKDLNTLEMFNKTLKKSR